MQIVTVNLPSLYLDAIAKLNEQGAFPSRSEAIRVALRDFLKRELEMIESLLDFNDEDKTVVVQKAPQVLVKKIDMRSIKKGW